MPLHSEDLGHRLAAVRVSRKLTQAELASATGKSRQTISSWESGHGRISDTDLAKCAAALDCGLQDLMAPVDAPIPVHRTSRLARLRARIWRVINYTKRNPEGET